MVRENATSCDTLRMWPDDVKRRINQAYSEMLASQLVEFPRLTSRVRVPSPALQKNIVLILTWHTRRRSAARLVEDATGCSRLGYDDHISVRVVDCRDGQICGRGAVRSPSINDASKKLSELVSVLALRAGHLCVRHHVIEVSGRRPQATNAGEIGHSGGKCVLPHKLPPDCCGGLVGEEVIGLGASSGAMLSAYLGVCQVFPGRHINCHLIISAE